MPPTRPRYVGLLCTVAALLMVATGCPDDDASTSPGGDVVFDAGGDRGDEEPRGDTAGPGGTLTLTGGRFTAAAGTSRSSEWVLSGQLLPASLQASSASWRLVGSP